MRQILVAIDVVGSTRAKDIYGEEHANELITAVLLAAEVAILAADPAMTCDGHSEGDSILVVGPGDPVAVYRAAVIYQGTFRAWKYGQLPIKIAIGYGEFHVFTTQSGVNNFRGRDLDYLYEIRKKCPSAGVVVTPPMYALLEEAGFGARLIYAEENNTRLYESDGDYQIPVDRRQRAERVTSVPIDDSVVIQPQHGGAGVKKEVLSWSKIVQRSTASGLLLFFIAALLAYIIYTGIK
jgi:hypothetical protein